MKNVISNFCKNKENGLFLLDMPTGFGKTYNVLEFIFENYNKEEYKNTKFFFITTLKKNLPFDELRERFVKTGKVAEFDQIAIKLESNVESVINNFDTAYKSMPESIRSDPRTKALHSQIEFYKRNANTLGEDNADCRKIAEMMQRYEEKDFHSVIFELLKPLKTAGNKLKAIENDKNFEWIGKLYPAVFSKEKRIFFMTVDKFILGNTTFVESTYSFYNNAIIDNSIIFIDEFDSTKDRMLNQIIKAGTENKIDSIALFSHIHHELEGHDIPSIYLRESEQRKQYYKEKNLKNELTLEEYFEKLKNIFREDYELYSKFFSFKIKQENVDIGRNFLFNDMQFHTVFSGKKSYVEIRGDQKEKQNWIVFSESKGDRNNPASVMALLGKIRGAMTFFQNNCRNIAYNYMANVNNSRENEDDKCSVENAIKSILSEFNLPYDYSHYLFPLIISPQNRRKNMFAPIEDGKGDLNYFNRKIYENGFRYYDFEDSPDHNSQSKIWMYDFPTSPERILLQMCSRARVIGISATATLDTVVGNYSLDYLKMVLGQDFYVLPKSEEKRLRDEFAKSCNGYSKTRINVVDINSNQDSLDKDYEELFGNEVSSFREMIQNKIPKATINNCFTQCEFIKVVKVLKAFILNDNVRSFLCLTNSLPGEDSYKVFNLKVLRETAKYFIHSSGKNLNEDSLIEDINTGSFEKNFTRIQERLSSGQKIFVMSAYQTIGAGQNRQYQNPKNYETIKVNDFVTNEKDFDCIYLQKPTHLIVNVKTGINSEDLVKAIFQTEFLMENGEVDYKTGERYIRQTFKCHTGVDFQDYNLKGTPYNTKSVANFAIRTLIQAVGRICRTPNKNKEINIFVDNAIFNTYDLSTIEKRILNPEFIEIIEKSKTICAIKAVDNKTEELQKRAEMLAHQHMVMIDSMRDFDRKNDIEQWKNLRQMLLMYPQVKESWIKTKTMLRNLYFETSTPIDSYSYEQESDYRGDITIRFDNSLPQKVNAEEICLPELMSGIPGLKESFEEKKYATKFVESKYWITPQLFNNIYKGALGEEIGKYILSKFANIELYEMDDEFFEFFDYKTKNGIYIDFKLWKNNMTVSAEEEKNHIMNKLKQCSGSKVLIINIYSEHDYRISSNGSIIEIPYLYRTDKHQLDMKMINTIRKELNA